METLLHNLSEVFAVSIIHSLWQCLIVYLVLRIVLSGVVNFSASAKHNISVAALYYATLWFVYTLFDQASHYNWIISRSTAFTAQPHLPLIDTLKHFSQVSDRYEVTIDHLLPYITIAYILGVVFHSLRLTSAWLHLRQLKQSLVVSRSLQIKIESVAKQIRLKKQVLSGYSERIDIPCVAGYLKPIIMLPLSLSSYLSAKEVEAIILHELAHVKRNDYFINALQQIMSVIFFFNPFVYLINRTVNLHRENACDDMVIATTNEPLIYAQALLKIEQNNHYELPLALAATGKKYHLLTRIERIMKTKKPMTNLRHLAAAVTILIASSLSLAWLNPAIGNGKLSVKNIKPAIKAMFASAQDTLPKPPAPPKLNKLAPPKLPKLNRIAPPPPAPKAPKRFNNYSYNYNGFRDPKLEEMGKQMEAYGKQMDAYYNGPAYKKMQEDMERSGKEMDAYYNSPAYKKMQEDLERSGKQIEEYYNSAAYKQLSAKMEKLGKEMDAYYSNPDLKKMNAEQERIGKEFSAAYGDGSDMKKVGDEMERMGKKMNEYYESPAFKKKAAELRKKYHVPTVYSYDENDQDPNVRAYLDELNTYKPKSVADAQISMKKLGEQMRDHYNSPQIKAAQRNMKTIGDSVRNAYNNPRIKQIQEEMRKAGDEMRNTNNNPAIKAQQEKIRKLSEQMQAYNNSAHIKLQQEQMRKAGEQMRTYGSNPQIKELQKNMKQLGEQMRAYTQTPEFKKKQEDWRKTHPNEWDNDKHSPASADVPTPAAPPVNN